MSGKGNLGDSGAVRVEGSYPVRSRLILARFYGDEVPVVIAAIDATVWEHWDAYDEKEWRDNAQRIWGMDPSDCEWSEVWAEFESSNLTAAFETPVVKARAVGDFDQSPSSATTADAVSEKDLS